MAYTFDAGPNAVLYALKEDTPLLLHLISRYFPPADLTKCVAISAIMLVI